MTTNRTKKNWMITTAIATALLGAASFGGLTACQDIGTPGGATWVPVVQENGLKNFRQPTGDWVVAGAAKKDVADEKKLAWTPGTGVIVNGPKGFTNNIFTQAEYGDVEAHVEFMVPKGSNSGVYFQGRYEIQVFDSYGQAKPTSADCGGVYERWNDNPPAGQPNGYEGHAPRVNASLPPGEWQSYDIVFQAPRFDISGKKVANAKFIKVVHNGKVVHENVEVTGPTRAAAFADEKPLGPLMLQGDHGPVAYRNIRILSLPAPGPVLSNETYQELQGYQVGGNRSACSAVEELIRATSAAQYGPIEDKLLEVLAAPQTTPDAKDFVCRMLARVGSSKSVPALAKLLTDEKNADMARWALEPMANREAGAALRLALWQTKGKLRAGVINSLGVRRDAEALSAISEYVTDTDPAIASAAIAASGRIGTPAAAVALEQAKGKIAPAHKTELDVARIACGNGLLASGKTSAAAAIFADLQNAPDAPAVQAAALRGMILTSGSGKAVELVMQALQGQDALRQEAALAAVKDATDPALANSVAAKMGSLPAEAQVALLNVLVEQRGIDIRPVLLQVIQNSKDDAVRARAIEGMARFGQRGDVSVLANLAVKGADADRSVAIRTLDRMESASADKEFVALVEKGEPALQVVALRALVNRRAEAAVPAMIKQLNSADAQVRNEAAKGLGELGTAGDLATLTATMIGTEDAALRDAIERSVKSICGRVADKAACGQILLPALAKAKTPAARAAVLRVLPRVGDAPALAAVKQGLADADKDVQDGAVRALAEWPNAAAAPSLLEVAKTTQNTTHAVLAMQGYVRLAGLPEVPMADRLAMYRSALAAAQRADEKRQALSGLAELPTPAALETIRGCLKDKDLVNEATLAVVKIAKPLASANSQLVMSALDEVKGLATTNDDVKRQINEVVSSLTPLEGYVMVWMLSGPYMEEGKDGIQLFDVAFDPEKGKGAWKLLSLANNSTDQPFILDLVKAVGGDNRVVYLKTKITSEKDQPALLEIGSDDGVKVWLNDKQVHANNTTRAVGPGADKVKVDLKQGANVLMLKINQGSGGWGACARLRNPEGGKITGVTVSPE